MKEMKKMKNGLALILIVSALPALSLRAEIVETVSDGPQNWTAPPYWSPPMTTGRAGPAGSSVRPAREALAVSSTPLPFVAITPCREYDSRSGAVLADNTPRTVTLTGAPCGIPTDAQAVAANITVFNIASNPGNAVFKVGTAVPPVTAWINYGPTETQRANAGVLPLGAGGTIVVQVNQGAGSVDFVVDVFGYYSPLGVVNTVNTLSGAVTLAQGTNVTITPTGQTLTIAASAPAGPSGPTGPPGTPGTPGSPGPTGPTGPADGTVFIYVGNAGIGDALAPVGSDFNNGANIERSAGIIPVACTADVFRVTTDSSPTTGSAAFTLFKNGLATTVTCTIPVGSAGVRGGCSAVAPSEAFAAGDRVWTSVSLGLGSSVSNINRAAVSWRCK
jgi:hypothetical protein